MIRRTLVALLLLTVSAVASAEAPKAKGAYLGISGGRTLVSTDGALWLDDDQDTALQGYVGYKFIKHFAIEARVADFGSYSDSFGSFGSFGSFDISSISIHALGIIPFGESGWELFGQIGVAKISQSGFGSDGEDNSAATAGIGVRWHINPKIAVAAQLDAYVWQNDFIGSEYNMSVGAQMLSFQVNF